MIGEWTSVIFGETLRRHLHMSNCKNRHLGRELATSQTPVTHSSRDPPYRGTEKTTLAGSPEGVEKLKSR